MISFFRLCCAAVVAAFLLSNMVRSRAPDTGDGMPLIAQARARGHTVTRQKDVLWGVSALSISVANCPSPVEAVSLEFDQATSSGFLPVLRIDDPGSLQISYEGETFNTLDRAALYRLRIQNGIAGFIRTGTWYDPPVVLLFWPTACAPSPIL